MLRHVISPSASYTKASNGLIRHRRLGSDAKILVLYVQGLPGECTCKPLSELAQKLEITGRAYQKAKQQLVANGYVHEWRTQGEGGRWVTRQLISNEPLTAAQAKVLRDSPPTAPPSTRFPTVGVPTGRVAGGQEPVEDHSDKTTPHPPSEARPTAEPVRETRPEPAVEPRPVAEPLPVPEPEPVARMASLVQLDRAERILLSLRHSRRELQLGVREARALAVDAVKWLEGGLSEADLRHALLAERPEGGVRSAVGFLRHRLVHKLPACPAPVASPPPPAVPVRELLACEGLGDEHFFRPVGEETRCAECRRVAAWERWRAEEAPAFPEGATWRERFGIVNGRDAVPAPLPDAASGMTMAPLGM